MNISEKKIIDQPIEKIFDWINDIPAYQDEIPWCVSSGIIHSNGEEHIRGFLEMKVGPFRRKIITDNTVKRPHSIEMCMVEGPFDEFSGSWRLKEITPSQTEVQLEMTLRWSDPWLESLVALSYEHLRIEALHILEQALLRRK